SQSITNVTNRLADPSNFPPAYKIKYDAIRKHQERVVSDALADAGGKEKSPALSRVRLYYGLHVSLPSPTVIQNTAGGRSGEKIDGSQVGR
ncbi:hypothetical protein HK104_008242, partial [Borealophlyctis nickersoniae]